MGRALLGIGLGLAGVLAAAAPALAQTSRLGGAGAWEAYGGRSQDGTRLCGMTVSNANRSRSLHFKWYMGTPGFVVQAFGQGWRIPPGTTLRVTLAVDGNPPWTTQGATGNGTMVQWRVQGDAFRPFTNQFRAGSRMTVAFPDGSETPWSVSLAGSSATLDLFTRCVLAQTDGAAPAKPGAPAPRPPGAAQPHQRGPEAPLPGGKQPSGPASAPRGGDLAT
ncbi:hypothetical protein ACI6QG_13095 [Roseococcus sp. DSY-14]|uniref:hypothetical protein n=1 Tax=Roseococcus sp. DSY-14 TaxID=3369650 RepID=UPI00387B7445